MVKQVKIFRRQFKKLMLLLIEKKRILFQKFMNLIVKFECQISNYKNQLV